MVKTARQPRIVLLELSKLDQFPKHFTSHYHTHLLCYKGKISFTFKDKPMVCKRGEFLFWFAESRLSQLQLSTNFKAKVLLVEKHFLIENNPNQSWSVNATLHSREYPIKRITAQDRKKIAFNFQLMQEKFLETDHVFYEELLKMQMRIFILEMWHTFAKDYERRKHSLQTATLYERFIHLVQEHCMTRREVQFYSGRLNITAKYLNQVSKSNSGITASEWIQRHVRERLIILLEDNNLNISEIADEMHFSSRSFFTRYVKKMLGVTPKKYRERIGE